MKIRDCMERLSRLDPDMDMNDLRECLTTSRGQADELVASLDEGTDNWDEFSARLTKDAVVPLLLEIRDLMLMPTSARGWLKPADMAKKVAEQVEINEAKCQERATEAEKFHDEAMATAEDEHRTVVSELTAAQDERLAEMRRWHGLGVEEVKRRHEEMVAGIKKDHGYESERFEERIAETLRQQEVLRERLKATCAAVPGQQADAAVKVLTDAADRVDAMGQMRLVRLVKRRSLFRNKDLDQTMLRVEADGILLSAKRLRRMATEVLEQGAWPIEFADGEEDTPEAKEALSRMLAPIRETEAAAAAAPAEDAGDAGEAGVEVESD